MTRPGDVVEVARGVVVGLCPKPASHTGVVAMVALRGAGVVVVDTGMAEYMPGALAPALAALGGGPADITALCSTHGHHDHTGGSRALGAISGAPTYFSASDAQLAGFGPDVPVGDGDRIVRGDLVLEVVATPGHTPGSVCFYEPSRRLLIVGDSVQGEGSTRKLPVYYHSGRQYRASLNRLRRLAINTLVVGHPLAWVGRTGCVFRGADCDRLLADSLAASAAISALAERAWHESGTRDHAILRRIVLDALTDLPAFARFDNTEPVEEDTDATIRSEFRDLG